MQIKTQLTADGPKDIKLTIRDDPKGRQTYPRRFKT